MPTEGHNLHLCLFKEVTHIPCPGCGMTRAFLSLIKGEFWKALSFNPASFLLLFFTLVSLLPEKLLVKFPKRAVDFTNSFLTIALFLLLIFWGFFELLPAIRLRLN
ncbi:DUF2752 domain-containing protein [bacterium]|nr:DUF2752 domain-containing protein [bacterium]